MGVLGLILPFTHIWGLRWYSFPSEIEQNVECSRKGQHSVKGRVSDQLGYTVRLWYRCYNPQTSRDSVSNGCFTPLCKWKVLNWPPAGTDHNTNIIVAIFRVQSYRNSCAWLNVQLFIELIAHTPRKTAFNFYFFVYIYIAGWSYPIL